METIKSYLETMFAALPQTEELQRAKQNLLETMEDKYNDLKSEGKSENEAVGQVISEFGNIDELTAELGVAKEEPVAALQEPQELQQTEEKANVLSDEDVEECLARYQKGGRAIGFGVALCILAPAALIAICGALMSNETGGIVAVCTMLLMIAAAVALFVVNGIKLDEYEKYKKEYITISDDMRQKLTKERKAYLPKFAASIAGGMLLIFGGIIVMIALAGGKGEFWGAICVSIMFAFIAAGVALFVSAGMRYDSYDLMLEQGDYRREKKYDINTRAGRITKTIKSIYWPVVVAIFLIWGLAFDGWEISWIVFPIAGVLSSALSGIVRLICKEPVED